MQYNTNLFVVFLAIASMYLAPAAHAYDKEMTISVDAGKIECFFHAANEGQNIDIEYQVIDGGHGDLDISFTLSDPIGLVIVSDFKKSENLHRHEVRKKGDYRFCFDNSFSSFNRKTVFFELIVEGDDAPYGGDGQQDPFVGLTQEEFYEMTVQDIMDYIGRIRMQMTRARQIQDLIRSHEARDRNLAEANFYKVNVWSFFQLCAMISVGLLQVYMLRSIFETNSPMSKLLKRITF